MLQSPMLRDSIDFNLFNNFETPRATSTERFFIDFLDVYDETDPAVIGILDLLLETGAINSDTRLYIFRGTANAFTVEGGAIFISDELISITPSIQALDYVITHERKHSTLEHFERMREVQKKLERGATLDSEVSLAATLRRNEGEADTGAFKDMDDRGQNPTAAFDMMTALDDYVRDELRKINRYRKKSLDSIHGDTSFRKMGMRLLPRLDKYKNLSTPKIQIPQHIKDRIFEVEERGEYQNGISGFVEALGTTHTAEIIRRASHLRPSQVAIARNKLTQCIQELSTSERTNDEFLLKILLRDVYPQIDAKYVNNVFVGQDISKLSSAERVAYYLCDILGNGARMLRNTDTDKSKRVDQLFAEYTPLDKLNRQNTPPLAPLEIMQIALQVCDAELFERFSIYFMNGLDTFLMRVVEFAVDNMIFETEDGEFNFSEFAKYFSLLYSKLKDVHQHTAGGHLSVNNILGPIGNALNGYGLDSDTVKLALNELQKELLREQQFSLPENYTRAERVVVILEEINIIAQESGGKLKDYHDQLVEKWRILVEDLHSPDELLQLLMDAKTMLYNIPTRLLDGVVFNSKFTMLMLGAFEEILGVIFQQTLGRDYDDGSFDDSLFAAVLHAIFNGTLGPIEQGWDFHSTLTSQKKAFTAEQFAQNYQLYETNIYLSPYGKTTFDLAPMIQQMSIERDSQKSELMRHLNLLVMKLFKQLPQDDFIDTFLGLHQRYPIVNTMDMIDLARYNPKLNSRIANFISKVVGSIDFDLANLKQVEFLYYLMHHSSETAFTIKFQEAILEKILADMTVEEAIAFYDTESEYGRLVAPPSLWQNFIDRQTWSRKNLELLSVRVEKQVKSMFNSDKVVDRYMVLEQVMHFLAPGKKAEFLAVILGNGVDDRMLKTFLYRGWVEAAAIQKLELSLNDISERLYRIGSEGKLILLTQLLIGENGVLNDRQAFVDFMDFFMKVFVSKPKTAEDKAIMSFLEKVLFTLGEEKDLGPIFFLLVGLLQDNILRLPDKRNRVDWLSIIRREDPGLGYEVTESYQDGVLARGKDADTIYERYIGINKRLAKSNYIIDAGDATVQSDSDLKFNYLSTVDTETAEEILKKITVRAKKSQTGIPAYVGKLSKLLGITLSERAKGRMSQHELMHQAAKHGDTMGKRFAQLAPLHVEQNIFDISSNMFDEAGNANIIFILRSLLAEWPDFWSYVEDVIVDKVAEGSMGAVIRVKPQQWWANQLGTTSDLAVKVMTPNPDYHAQEIHDLLVSVFGKLAKSDPTYETGLLLISDVFRWISTDYNFEGSLEKDAHFRSLYNGFALDNNSYQIHVPRSFVATQAVLVDEYVENTINFTKPEKLEAAGVDLREVMKLTVANYIYQLKQGFIHSNLNPGNIAVKPDTKQIVFFDRGYVLDIRNASAEKELLTGIVANLHNLANTGPILMNYIFGQGGFDMVKLGELAPEMMSIIGSDKDVISKLGQIIVVLRKAKIEIPLEISLLLLNLGYLDKLARRFGFDGGFAEIVQNIEV